MLLAETLGVIRYIVARTALSQVPKSSVTKKE